MKRHPLAASLLVARIAARTLAAAALLLTAISALPTRARAQSSGNGFLFTEPLGSFAVRGGFAQARGASDIFSFVIDELTLGHGDFGGASLATDLAIRVAPRADVVLSVSYAGSNAKSEFRRFVDNNDLPIEQNTSLMRVPLTVSGKLYLTSRGRSIGRYAWIPARLAPYVGAGAGMMWYRFRQRGDFIDKATLDVFTDSFQSAGWTPTANAFGGLDVSLGTRYGLTGEGRYLWGRAPMSEDFSNFHRIDLSGYTASLGFYVRF